MGSLKQLQENWNQEDWNQEDWGQDDIEFEDLQYEDLNYGDTNQGDSDEEEYPICEITKESFQKAVDALMHSISEKGCVDLAYMKAESGFSKSHLIAMLNGTAILQDPAEYEVHQDEYKGWYTFEQYINGNIQKLIQEAKEVNHKFHFNRFLINIQILEDELPSMPEAEDVEIQFGATWIPLRYYARFIRETFHMVCDPEVKYDPYIKKWEIKNHYTAQAVQNYFTYGTSRKSGIQILEAVLNGRPVQVTDSVPKPDGSGTDSVINKDETMAVQEKQRLLMAEFSSWIRADKNRLADLMDVYYQTFAYKRSQFNGSYLQFTDMNPDVTLYDHQKNAVARIVLSPSVLLSHDVGSGKTYEMECGAHELYRTGISKKNLIVVPNNIFEDVVKTHEMLYPQDKILAVYPKQFCKAKREKMLKEMKDGDYVAMYMAYSSFDMLDMSQEYYIQKKKDEINECARLIRTCPEDAHLYNVRHKQLTKQLEKLQEKYNDQTKRKMTDCFDHLGITGLFVDEIHNYKNIGMDTALDIVGLRTHGSKKANAMLEKVHHVQEGGGHVVFATGTPLTNSLADLYTWQKYLQNEELEFCNLGKFSNWVNTFCQSETSFEIDVDSQSFRFKTRFSKFHNLPELMAMFGSVCDFYHLDDSAVWGLPTFMGYRDIEIQKSHEQRSYIDEIVKRTEKVRANKVNRKEDNLLKITTDGRKAALDIRLVKPNAFTYRIPNKVKACADQIYELYCNYPGTSQLVFCDISTPKDGFNIYDELKEELIRRGIAKEEIAFVHEGTTERKRKALFNAVNKAKIRVMIGSTMKLGTGVNVQEHLIALHHLDVPWKPSDVVQREGRLIRQGNQNPEVFIYRYITEGSFDSYNWQLLENKQKFIASFLSASLTHDQRQEQDIADTVLNYAEIKALCIGNPLIKRRVEVSNRLEHTRIASAQRKKQLLNLESLIESLPGTIENVKKGIAIVDADDDYYQAQKQVVKNEVRQEFGERILAALADNEEKDEETFFDTYQGFNVVLPRMMEKDKPFVYLRRLGGGEYKVDMEDAKGRGCSTRLDHVLNDLPGRLERLENKLEGYKMQLAEAEVEVAKGNMYEAQIVGLEKKLLELDEKLDKELKDEGGN